MKPLKLPIIVAALVLACSISYAQCGPGEDTKAPRFSGDGTQSNPFINLEFTTVGSASSGVYYFDFDGTTFQGYLDNDTNGGGWLLILNYVHAGGDNSALNVRTLGNDLPLPNASATLGNDESGTSRWGHAGNDLAAKIDFQEMRFYAETSAHTRKIHFTTSYANGLSYVKTGSGSFSGINNIANYTLLSDHTANLPQEAEDAFIDKGDEALTDFPFWKNGTYHWGIRGLEYRWEVDDYPDDGANNTIHQVWVRGDASPTTFSIADKVEEIAFQGSFTVPDYIISEGVKAVDNCTSSVTLTQSPVSGTMLLPGTHEITITATDEAGNKATLSFNLTIAELLKPGGVSNDLSHWFKADAGTGTTVHGASVTSWEDKAGANDATKTGTNPITYQEGFHNYNPSLLFVDGSDGHFNVANNWNQLAGTNYTVFAVVERASDIARGYFLGKETTLEDAGWRLGYRDDLRIQMHHDGGNADIIADLSNGFIDSDTEQASLFVGGHEEGVGKMLTYLTSTEPGEVIAPNGPLKNHLISDTSLGSIGRWRASSTFTWGFRGYISEIIVYTNNISTDDQLKVKSYLAMKYGLILDNSGGGTSGDYLDSDGNTIWDASTLSSFHNDIGVIGRDDYSGLNQKQSIAASKDAVVTISIGSSVAVSNQANTASFDDDLDFLAWGHNDTDNIPALENLGSPVGPCQLYKKRLDRDWKVQNTGSVGAVTVQFDMTGIGDPVYFNLVVDQDGDADYTTGNQTTYSNGTVNGRYLTFTNVTLSDGYAFTLFSDTEIADITYINGAWSGGSGTDGALDNSATDSSKSVAIKDDVTLTDSHNCNCLEVTSVGSLTLSSNSQLTVSGSFNNAGTITVDSNSQSTVDGDIDNAGTVTLNSSSQLTIDGHINNTGTVTLDSNSHLLSNGNISNTGTGTVTVHSGASLICPDSPSFTLTHKRNLSDNWHLVSSGVVNQTIEDLIVNHEFAGGSGANIGIGTYDNTIPGWSYATELSTGTIPSGEGRAIKLKNPGDISFSGDMPLADVDISISDGGSGGAAYNFLGNPFPSYMPMNNTDPTASNNILSANTGVLSQQTIWVWDYSQSETGYIPINHATASIDGNRYLAPGQGFFVESNATGGTFTFPETMQSHQSTDSFTRNSTNVPRIQLLIEDNATERETDILYLPNATTGWDNGFDSTLFGGSSNSFALYTHLVSDSQGQNLAIQSLPDNDFENMIIPVGVNASSGTSIEFTAVVHDFPAGINVYLEDRDENTFTNLSASGGTYTITTSSNLDGIGRFYLHTTSSVLNISEQSLNNVSAYITTPNTLRITGIDQGEVTASIYTIQGREVHQSQFTGLGVNDIPLSTMATGIYILNIQSEQGKLTKKIVIK